MSIETLTEDLRCPNGSSPCEDQKSYECFNNGICCEPVGLCVQKFCICQKCYIPRSHCHRRNSSCSSTSSGFEGTQVTDALDWILGVLLVCCLVAAVFLLIKCYRNRKKQCQDDQEIKKSLLSSPEFGEDEVITKLMITETGQHNWKQNVKLITHDSSRMKSSPWSDSFPGNLLEIQWTDPSVKKSNQTNTKEAHGGERICIFPADEGNDKSSPNPQLLLDRK